MKLVDRKISLDELKQMAEKNGFGLVKAVVDVKKRVMVVDAEMHADEEGWLLEQGSIQSDLWGINLYPDKYDQEEFIEYDSMINLRPGENNMSRGVDNLQVRKLIKEIVKNLVEND